MDESIDEFYNKFIGQPVPKLLQCYKCNWKGNKLKIVNFKNGKPKRMCPNCGGEGNLGGTVELVFWRTANGYDNPISFEDLVKGKTN